jgi:hypothetical protein
MFVSQQPSRCGIFLNQGGARHSVWPLSHRSLVSRKAFVEEKASGGHGHSTAQTAPAQPQRNLTVIDFNDLRKGADLTTEIEQVGCGTTSCLRSTRAFKFCTRCVQSAGFGATRTGCAGNCKRSSICPNEKAASAARAGVCCKYILGFGWCHCPRRIDDAQVGYTIEASLRAGKYLPQNMRARALALLRRPCRTR